MHAAEARKLPSALPGLACRMNVTQNFFPTLPRSSFRALHRAWLGLRTPILFFSFGKSGSGWDQYGFLLEKATSRTPGSWMTLPRFYIPTPHTSLTKNDHLM